MIDEATLELLSRHLDGDLEPAERRLLETRLEADPSLASELAGLERLRDGLRELAARDEPPGDLDAALEPLRRSAPPARGLRPAYRWLALAATLLVGATVTFKVAQRASTPAAPSTPRSRELADTGRAPFQLRPLPTSPVPEDEELLGAADHLLASPPPTPVMPEPPIHTAVGPLTEGERQIIARSEVEPERDRRDREAVELRAQAPPREEDRSEERRPAAADGAKREADRAPKGAAPTEISAVSTSAPRTAAGRTESLSQAVAPRRGTVTLSTQGGAVEIPFSTHLDDRVLERAARVTVRAGVIVAVGVPSTNEAPPLPDTLVSELTGLQAGGVADGVYEAAIRVD